MKTISAENPKSIFSLGACCAVCVLLCVSQSPLLADAAQAPWPMYRQNQYHTGSSTIPATGSVGVLKWKYATGAAVYSSPAIGLDGTLYIGSHDFYLYAVHPDGTLKWKYLTGGYVDSSPAIDSGGTVYVGSCDNHVHAVRPDGTQKWKYETGGTVYCSPVIASGTIYVGSSDSWLYALDDAGTCTWKYKTGGDIYSPPAIAYDGTVYVGSKDNAVYALDPAGTLVWKYATAGSVYSSPAIGDNGTGTVYFGSNDYNVFAVNPDSSTKWTRYTGDCVFSSPAIGSDGTVYVGSDDGNVYALDPDDGAVLWKYQTGGPVHYTSPAVGADGTVYIESEDNYLYALNSAGGLAWRYHIGGSSNTHASPAIGSDGTVYIGSGDGSLYAIIVTTPPALSWTGEAGYEENGIVPDGGAPSLTCAFRVRYADDNNDPPASGYPKLHVQKSGAEVPGSPFTMTYVSGSCNAGALYAFSRTFDADGSDYSYFFEAYDVWGATATGAPLTPSAGPHLVSMASLAPSSAYNSSPVARLVIGGAGYAADSTVTLRKTGQTDIVVATDTITPVEITGTVDLAGAVTGYWHVVISTGGAGSYQVVFSSAFLYSSMTITSVTPDNGANTMPLAITDVSGNGFVAGSTVKIVKDGHSDIIASTAACVSPEKLTCTIDLTGASTGYWDVVVTTGGPGSVSATLRNGILVNIVSIVSITPESGYHKQPVVITELSGGGFGPGTTVRLVRAGREDIAASNIVVISQSRLTCAFNLSGAAGYWDVVVTDGGAGTETAVLRNGFLVKPLPLRITQLLDDAVDSTVYFLTEFGDVTVQVPAGAFGENVTLAISTAAVPASARAALKITDIACEITTDPPRQPRKDVTITVNYRDAYSAGLDEQRLMLAYSDAANRRWVTVPSTVYPDMHRIVAKTGHLSIFAVVLWGAASDLSEVIAYPIPFNPRRGVMTFDNLTDDATIKIFTIAGQLIRTAGPSSANGRIAWDGTNDSGSTVASGIYIVLVKDGALTKQFKIAVEK